MKLFNLAKVPNVREAVKPWGFGTIPGVGTPLPGAFSQF